MPNNPPSPNAWLHSYAGQHTLIRAIQHAVRRQFNYWLNPAHIQVISAEFSDKMSGNVFFQYTTQHGNRECSATFRCHPDGQLSLDNLARQQPSVSRRDFLKRTLFLSSAAAILPTHGIDQQITMIPLPPSIMLHSQHGINMRRDGFFPQFLHLLQEQQYTTVTFESWLCAVLNETRLPEKPLIVSMDDMAMDVGNPSFQYFRNMHDQLAAQGMVGTFGIVTRPNLRQDADRWDEVRSWADEGFEMATHTSEHTNFNQADTSARVDLSQEHVDAEIINSAHMIQDHVEHPVNVLITPYGSGFNRQTQAIHPDIISACQRANIRMVVGITDGRAPMSLDSITNPLSILYCGRTTPGNDNAYEAIYNVNMWGREGVRSVVEATQ